MPLCDELYLEFTKYGFYYSYYVSITEVTDLYDFDFLDVIELEAVFDYVSFEDLVIMLNLEESYQLSLYYEIFNHGILEYEVLYNVNDNTFKLLDYDYYFNFSGEIVKIYNDNLYIEVNLFEYNLVFDNYYYIDESREVLLVGIVDMLYEVYKLFNDELVYYGSYSYLYNLIYSGKFNKQNNYRYGLDVFDNELYLTYEASYDYRHVKFNKTNNILETTIIDNHLYQVMVENSINDYFYIIMFNDLDLYSNFKFDLIGENTINYFNKFSLKENELEEGVNIVEALYW